MAKVEKKPDRPRPQDRAMPSPPHGKTLKKDGR